MIGKIKNRQGAFLLEALIAVFILSVSLVALIRGLMSSMNAAAEAERYFQATLAADNALIEVVRLNGQEITAPKMVENFSEQVKTDISIVRPEDPRIPSSLQQARVRSVWPGKIKDKEIDAATLIFGFTNEKK